MALIFDSLGADFLTLILVVITSSYFYLKYKFTYWSSRGVPCIPPTVPFGNIGDQLLQKRTLGDVVEDVYVKMKKDGQKFGGLYMVDVPNFVPVDPDLIKTIMTTEFQSFHDRSVLVNEKTDPLSGNLFGLKGYKWRNLRVKLTPTFTSGKMKMMFQLLLACGEQLKQTMEECTKIAGPIEIKDLLSRFTTDIVGNVVFGINCNSLENPSSEFRKYCKMIFDTTVVVNIRNMGQFICPGLLKLFRISNASSEANKFFLDVMKQTVDYRENNKVVTNDFMNLLLKLKNNENVEDENENEGKTENQNSRPGLTFNELAAQAFVFFLAGFETSSSTMTFALYELSANIKLQEKVRKEVCEALGKHDGKFTYDAIMEMRYMDKIVKETLRKYPIVPVLVRECVEDFEIPDSDVVIEKGTGISISVQGLHRDPEYYPDPMTFDPERFNEENKATRHPYTYIPFGEGPRNCIGMRFGLMQTKVGLAVLLSKYKFTLNKKTISPLQMEPVGFILNIKGGVWLNAEEITL